MAKKNVHVVSSGNGWAVKPERAAKPLSTHRTQGAASDAGRKVAKQNQSELVIHRSNGQIRDKDSMADDMKLRNFSQSMIDAYVSRWQVCGVPRQVAAGRNRRGRTIVSAPHD